MIGRAVTAWLFFEVNAVYAVLATSAA